MDEKTNEAMQAAKNAVFNAKQNAGEDSTEAQVNKAFPTQKPLVTGGVPTKSRAQAAMEKFGIKIPVGAVPLPSQGLVYDRAHPLHRKQSVEYRGMTTREEDILMSQAYIKRGTVIDELIKSCLIDKSIDVRSLIAGDRNALMLAIRATGYGELYKPSFSCPNCGEMNHLEINLSGLPIKNLSIEPVTQDANLFEFKFPTTDAVVHFKFLTGEDEFDIQAEIKANKKRGGENTHLITTRLLHSIVSINGNASRHDIAEAIQYFPASDSQALRAYIDKHEPGVDMKTDFECSNCNHEAEVAMPMDATFFWPNART